VTGSGFSTSGLSLPMTVAAGGSGTITLKFAPSTSGSVTGNLSLASNAPTSPTLISLSGGGIAPSPSSLQITTSSLPAGQIGSVYQAALSASGGTPPYSWSIDSGSLPPELSFSAIGSISGIPTTAGNYGLGITVSDSGGQTATTTVSITVNPASVIPQTFFGMHVAVGATGYSTPILAPIVVGAVGKPVGTVWHYMETARGTYDFSDMNGAQVFARAHGAPIFDSLDGNPAWAVTDTSNCQGLSCWSAPSDIAKTATCQAPLASTTTTDCQLKEFYTTLVQTYTSVGIQTGCSSGNPQCNGVIQMYEGWNEPSDYGGLGTEAGFMTFSQWVTEETDRLNTIRANDPNAQVCSPAFSVSSYSGDINTLNGFFAASPAPPAFDCYDLHIGEPTPEGQITDINTFKSVLTTAGITNPLIYATESGAWGCNSSAVGMTDQAYIARTELLYWSNNVKRHYWYAYDSCRPLTNQPATSTLNASGIAYGNLESWMVGATMFTPCAANGTVWTCGLSRPNGYQALAVWDTAGTSTFSVPSQYTQYQDLEGNTNSISGSVTIGPEPILLTNGVAP
jgi:hypothetical protein